MGALFKSPKIPVPPPLPESEPPEAPLPMPDPDDPLLKARKKRAAAVKGKQGLNRLSTILSEDFESLGSETDDADIQW